MVPPSEESESFRVKQDIEIRNLELAEQKLLQELADLRRPYLLRNSQLLSSLVTSIAAFITAIAAIIGGYVLIRGNYFQLEDALNKQQAQETTTPQRGG